MKKRDYVLIGAILFVAVIVSVTVFLCADDGGYVVVRTDGVEVARYSLSESGEYSLLDGKNILRIEGGEAYIVYADCPDKLCIKQGKISKSGETVTCLPNRLTVTVYSNDGDIEIVAD